MASYLVTWEIDIEADSPQDAARQALAIQRDAESSAICFTVTHQTTQTKIAVDLENPEEENPENVPCEVCGSTENLLHFNHQCTDCFMPALNPNDSTS